MEPIIGEIYHLYQRDGSDDCFLSLVPPNTWKKKHIGSYKLDSERVWNEIKN